jgi:hypothetical protein
LLLLGVLKCGENDVVFTSRFASCAVVASVFATGDSRAADAAVLCFKQRLSTICPGVQCIAYGVLVSGLPRFACVEVSVHVANPAALGPSEDVKGARVYRACDSSDSRLIVAFVRDGECGVSDLAAALASVGDASDDCVVACTAWIAGPLQEQLAAVLDADAGRNWSVLCAHGISCGDLMDAACSCAAVLSIARLSAQP